MLGQTVEKRCLRRDRVDTMDQQDWPSPAAPQRLDLAKADAEPDLAGRAHDAATAIEPHCSSSGSRSCSCGNTSRAASVKLFSASAWVTRPCRVIMMMWWMPPTRRRNSFICLTTVSGLPANIWPCRTRLSTSKLVGRGRREAPLRHAAGAISGAVAPGWNFANCGALLMLTVRNHGIFWPIRKASSSLDGWPDTVEGLTRLKRKYILATLSNGNVALMVNMAKYAVLPWDAILGAEVARAYKPQPEAYDRTAAFLDLKPGQCMMVAAHNGDLVAARGRGFHTAFVSRPLEHGPNKARDLKAEHDFDVLADNFIDLAAKLGC